MSGRGLFFQSERIRRPVFFTTHRKGRRSQVTAALRKTISQKKILTKPGHGLILRVYSPEVMAEYQVTSQEGPIKPLKIRPSAIKPIDIVWRRSAGPDFCCPPVEDAGVFKTYTTSPCCPAR